MRVTMPMLALALALGLVPVTRAQTRPETAGLQGYALQLQDAENRLRQARDAAAQAPAQSQQGAVSPERGELAQAGQAALRILQNAPPAFTEQETYQQAERRFRQHLADFGAGQRLGGDDSTIAAADQALRTLADLRQQVTRATGQGSDTIPAPPTATGGGAGR